jgi:hypothetical protein
VAQHEAVALELAERRREHPARDAVDRARELVEALGAAGEAGEHGEAPLRTEDAQGALEGVETRGVCDPGTGGCGTGRHDVVQYGTSVEQRTQP